MPAAKKQLRRTTQTEVSIMWKKPSYQDLRIGFEVTMYFSNR